MIVFSRCFNFFFFFLYSALAKYFIIQLINQSRLGENTEAKYRQKIMAHSKHEG